MMTFKDFEKRIVAMKTPELKTLLLKKHMQCLKLAVELGELQLATKVAKAAERKERRARYPKWPKTRKSHFIDEDEEMEEIDDYEEDLQVMKPAALENCSIRNLRRKAKKLGAKARELKGIDKDDLIKFVKELDTKKKPMRESYSDKRKRENLEASEKKVADAIAELIDPAKTPKLMNLKVSELNMLTLSMGIYKDEKMTKPVLVDHIMLNANVKTELTD